jgi:hypothetical protein
VWKCKAQGNQRTALEREAQVRCRVLVASSSNCLTGAQSQQPTCTFPLPSNVSNYITNGKPSVRLVDSEVGELPLVI